MKTLQSNLIKTFFLLLLGTLVSSFNPSSTFAQKEKKVREEKAPPDMTLEGKVYTITVTEMGNKKAKAKDDQINFKSGKFKSKYFFEEYKFPGGIYTAEADTSPSGAVTITFEVVCKFEK